MDEFGIIFDCDGTIIDSEDQVIQSLHHALKKVNGLTRSSQELRALFGPGADQILLKVLGDEKKSHEAFEHYIENQREVVADMRVYRGIRELLTHLKKEYVPTALVTGRHSRDLEIVLEAHQLKKYFQVLVSDDQLKDPKPSPEGLFIAASQLDIAPKYIYYVGDSLGDMQTAHKAGARAIAALWDWRVDKKAMKKENPYFMAERPLQIWEKFFEKNQEMEMGL